MKVKGYSVPYLCQLSNTSRHKAVIMLATNLFKTHRFAPCCHAKAARPHTHLHAHNVNNTPRRVFPATNSSRDTVHHESLWLLHETTVFGTSSGCRKKKKIICNESHLKQVPPVAAADSISATCWKKSCYVPQKRALDRHFGLCTQSSHQSLYFFT